MGQIRRAGIGCLRSREGFRCFWQRGRPDASPQGWNDCESRDSRSSPGLTVALNCGVGFRSTRMEILVLRFL